MLVSYLERPNGMISLAFSHVVEKSNHKELALYLDGEFVGVYPGFRKVSGITGLSVGALQNMLQRDVASIEGYSILRFEEEPEETHKPKCTMSKRSTLENVIDCLDSKECWKGEPPGRGKYWVEGENLNIKELSSKIGISERNISRLSRQFCTFTYEGCKVTVTATVTKSLAEQIKEAENSFVFFQLAEKKIKRKQYVINGKAVGSHEIYRILPLGENVILALTKKYRSFSFDSYHVQIRPAVKIRYTVLKDGEVVCRNVSANKGAKVIGKSLDYFRNLARNHYTTREGYSVKRENV